MILGYTTDLVQKVTSRICVIGLGHVGLPTALSFAALGWDVVGADNDAQKIEAIQAGRCPFYEPGLEALLQENLLSSKFQVTDDVESAIRSASILFICVWTSQKENGEADLTHIEALARVIARNLNGYKLIVEKSTTPAGTGQCIKATIERYLRAENKVSLKSRVIGAYSASRSDSGPGDETLFDVASNPEFQQEGRVVEDLLYPDRIICGSDSERALKILRELYSSYECPIVMTDLNTAELIKHAANAFLATKISFINMIADLCEAVGADIQNVSHGIGLDARIGQGFLNAGIGFGGYCLPKDLKSLLHLAETAAVDCSLLKETEKVNRQRIEVFLRKVRSAVWVVKDKTIGVLGLAFKPETDDIREAPSIAIVEALLREGANLQLYDPQAVSRFRCLFPEQPRRVSYCESAYRAAEGAHALLLLTEWEEFRSLDLVRIQDLMEVPVLVDGRNVFDAETVHNAGLEYWSMGRKSQKPGTFAAVVNQ